MPLSEAQNNTLSLQAILDKIKHTYQGTQVDYSELETFLCSDNHSLESIYYKLIELKYDLDQPQYWDIYVQGESQNNQVFLDSINKIIQIFRDRVTQDHKYDFYLFGACFTATFIFTILALAAVIESDTNFAWICVLTTSMVIGIGVTGLKNNWYSLSEYDPPTIAERVNKIDEGRVGTNVSNLITFFDNTKLDKKEMIKNLFLKFSELENGYIALENKHALSNLSDYCNDQHITIHHEDMNASSGGGYSYG
ncbi:MAG: hypothetical protein CMF42_05950 [Legionellales bacterium]|nr:hypothetical protein [Legionellales bacterium]OUX66954.1 MAG: hypothetical protein CBD38_04295 [bacterium TMED178]|tara:strand:- start:5944 stop:6699 length:756 start_codon:yes stop_codon:yes gene_type:complete